MVPHKAVEHDKVLPIEHLALFDHMRGVPDVNADFPARHLRQRVLHHGLATRQ